MIVQITETDLKEWGEATGLSPDDLDKPLTQDGRSITSYPGNIRPELRLNAGRSLQDHAVIEGIGGNYTRATVSHF